jgi:hypothetical protein
LPELEDYLRKGYHVIGMGVEPTDASWTDGHDPERTTENLYFDSKCRHSHIELVEINVQFSVERIIERRR